MIIWAIIALIFGFVLVGVILAIVFKKAKKKKNLPNHFRERWLAVQRLCAKKDTWALAVMSADKLLEEGLRAKRLKGKSMGERMVSAQRQFTDNDSVWYAHNLAKKLMSNPKYALRESEAKKALVGVGRALRDLELINGK